MGRSGIALQAGGEQVLRVSGTRLNCKSPFPSRSHIGAEIESPSQLCDQQPWRGSGGRRGGAGPGGVGVKG